MKYCKFLMLPLWAICLFPKTVKAESIIPERDYPLLGTLVFIDQEDAEHFKNHRTIKMLNWVVSKIRKHAKNSLYRLKTMLYSPLFV